MVITIITSSLAILAILFFVGPWVFYYTDGLSIFQLIQYGDRSFVIQYILLAFQLVVCVIAIALIVIGFVKSVTKIMKIICYTGMTIFVLVNALVSSLFFGSLTEFLPVSVVASMGIGYAPCNVLHAILMYVLFIFYLIKTIIIIRKNEEDYIQNEDKSKIESNKENEWKCVSCGTLNNGGLYCASCGEKRIPPETTLHCIECGEEIIKDAKFCSHCGAEIKSSWTCPTCGTKDLETKFCPHCGTRKS